MTRGGTLARVDLCGPASPRGSGDASPGSWPCSPRRRSRRFPREGRSSSRRSCGSSIAAGDEVFLSARPLPGEGVDAFVQRLTDDPRAKSEIFSPGTSGAAPPAARRLRPDPLPAPLGQLPARSRSKRSSRADRAERRRVGPPRRRPRPASPRASGASPSGSPETVATTGRSARPAAIPSLETREGQTVRDPREVSCPRRSGTRPLAAGRRRPRRRRPRSSSADDEKGRYALYRLQARRGAVLGGRRALHRARPRRGRQRQGRGDRRAQRHHDVHAIPVGLPDQDPDRGPVARVPSLRRPGADRGGEGPARDGAVRQPRAGRGPLRGHVRARCRARRARHGRHRGRRRGGAPTSTTSRAGSSASLARHTRARGRPDGRAQRSPARPFRDSDAAGDTRSAS